MNRCLSLLCGLVAPVVLSAQDIPTPTPTHVWTGGSPLNDLWENAVNWGGTSLPVNGSSTTILGFGAANHQYTSENTKLNYQVRNLVFLEDAGAYTLRGEAIRIQGGGAPANTLNVIYNRSDYLQTIENNLYFAGNMTFHTGAAGIRWSGSAESTEGAALYVLTKRGVGDLIVSGNLNPEDQGAPDKLYKTLRWVISQGAFVIDASTHSFASNSPYQLSGGEIRVIGANSGLTTVELGEFMGVFSKKTNHIVIDSNGGSGTTLSFTNWALVHNGSPGLEFANLPFGNLHFDIRSPGSEVRMGTISYNVGTELSPDWRSPMRNGLIHYATVTDSVKTGFATIVGGDERHNGGAVARFDDYVPLTATGLLITENYRVTGSLELTGALSDIYTLTIGGAGVLSASNPSGRLNVRGALLMEEGVGDYTITVPYLYGSSGASWRVFQYSTDGVLTLTGHLGGTSGNYDNSAFTLAGTGTVRLTGDGDFRDVSNPLSPKGFTVTGGYVVSSGRLELDGLGTNTASKIDVYGALGGKGQIGGGIKWVWRNGDSGYRMYNDGTRYTPVIIYDGGTIDASNHENKALTIMGSLTLYELATYHMVLGENRDAPLLVLSDPGLELDVASVTLAGDLSLSLNYAPSWGEWIILLRTDGVITGEFATVNGNAFTQYIDTSYDGTGFTLDYGARTYEFLIVYDYDVGDGITAVALRSIPEPAHVTVWMGAAALGVLFWLRRKNTAAS
jgi:hypothetical protein